MSGDAVSMNILGVVRNGGSALIDTINRIESLSVQLHRYSVTIATNDNTDDTDRVLSEYADRNQRVEILQLDGLISKQPDRIERITMARNAVLKRLEEKDSDLDLTLVLDLDGPNVCLDVQAVLTAAQRVVPLWEGVFANSKPAYYDIYALRCPGWCDEDVWQRIQNTRRPLFGRLKWRKALLKSAVFDRQFHIPAETPLIPVDSAFGGAGLYKTRALRGLRYSCRDEKGHQVCEHVMLHKQLRDRGARLFIDPALTTLAPDHHLGESSGKPLPQHLIPVATGAA
ncbi:MULTISPECIES: hypothetical protein [unclassified Ruegeria]|uniref:hypothetical protein n=1 Tax=unclassified Ruegeria TaxID=2625375 RepID=UPI0014877A62|nr:MULTISPECIES: hypothetical protein [unclassified Ruegeria]NOD36361.1 hypothetical protein [Ruegeria sp. HKCCD7296]NOE35454.1 hypothetical protein [Ruegeria sp. HKCCD7318]